MGCASGKQAEPQEDVDRQRDVGSIIIATPSPSIPTPNRPSNKPSVAQMAKSVTEMRMEEEEMWRAIVSVNSKNFIDVASIGNSTPIPERQMQYIKQAYARTVAEFKWDPNTMQSAIGRMLEECHPSVTFKEERPLTIQEADFLDSTGLQLQEALDTIQIKGVGSFVIAWDDETPR